MENRKTKITKKLIQESFLELLDAMPLSKIKIKDVCLNADVNRSTFYDYYHGVEELLEDIENTVLQSLPAFETPPENYDSRIFLSMLEKYFIFVKNNERLFRLLVLRSERDNFLKKLVDTVVKKYPSENSANSVKNPVPLRYAYVYCINGVTGIVREWIETNFTLSPLTVAQLCLKMSVKAAEAAENVMEN